MEKQSDLINIELSDNLESVRSEITNFLRYKVAPTKFIQVTNGIAKIFKNYHIKVKKVEFMSAIEGSKFQEKREAGKEIIANTVNPPTIEYYISAKQARELSENGLKQRINRELNMVFKMIKNHIEKDNSGERLFSIYFTNVNFCKETIDELRRLEYTIDQKNHKDENIITISW